MTARSLCERIAALALLGATAVASASCGEAARTGRSPAFLILDSLTAARGPAYDEYGTTLLSDVQTLVSQQVNGQTLRIPTIFNDLGRAQFRVAMKNPGTAETPLGPSTLNEITITRYRVEFRRADGRNTPGVDVPYGFDGAFTLTVPANSPASAGFDLVRHQMKAEPPLRNLVGGGSARFISTIADVTFFGRDQAGNEVSVRGSISVNFGDWADPE